MTTLIRTISCTVCPLSCVGEVGIDDNGMVTASGFACQRGIHYASEEVTAPKRMLTTTIRVTGGHLPLLPVVSDQPLPKAALLPCARKLAQVTVKAPVEEGEVVYADINGLGVDIIASREVRLAQKEKS